jgi:hypothetical protein
VLLARDMSGYRSLCRLVSAAQMAGTKGVPRFGHQLLAGHTEGLVALSGCRHGEINRRLLAGDRDGAQAAARRLAGLFGEGRSSSSCSTTCCPTTTGWSGGTCTWPTARPAGGRDQRRPLRADPPAASCRTCWSASATG